MKHKHVGRIKFYTKILAKLIDPHDVATILCWAMHYSNPNTVSIHFKRTIDGILYHGKVVKGDPK